MALINCQECNREYSDTAKACPHCGFTKKGGRWGCFWLFWLAIFLGIGFPAIIGAFFGTQTEITIDNDTESIAAPSVGLSNCETAMLEASTVSSMQDTHEDLYPAFLQCNSVNEFIAASRMFPNALDGADEKIYIYNQCQVDYLKKSAVCIDFLKK